MSEDTDTPSETQPSGPSVSVVVPALNEAEFVSGTLESIRAQTTDRTVELLVVDGGSTDGTRALSRAAGATVLAQDTGGIGAARHQGAQAATGEWLVFVDADTQLRPTFLESMIEFLEDESLAAGTARCRVTDDPRGRLFQGLYNHVFPRKDRPVLPGFATVVCTAAYHEVGGYPDLPSEDRALSHRLADRFEVGFHPDVLVETSARRLERDGFLRTMGRYLWLDYATLERAQSATTRPHLTLLAGLLALVAAALQIAHGLAFTHPETLQRPALASLGLIGGLFVYLLGTYRQVVLGCGLIFVGVQLGSLVAVDHGHGSFGSLLGSVLLALGLSLLVLSWRIQRDHA